MVVFQRVHEALERAQAIAEAKKSHIIYTKELSRMDRELLLRHRWLEEIIRGWYLLIRPDLPKGDSTAWYANFWDFLKCYLEHHYSREYCLSAKCSLDMHLGISTVPRQIIVMATKGSGTPVELPYETSLLVYADPSRLPEKREVVRGLQVMSLPYALCKVSPTYFQTSPQDAEIALRSIQNPQELLRVIAEHHFKNGAGRLIGAYRFLQNNQMADILKNGLRDIGMMVIEKNPFETAGPIIAESTIQSPYALRIFALWKRYRTEIISLFPKPPGLPKDKKAYLDHVAEIYGQDAYNSLSIEGYQVSRELIEKVKQATWKPEHNPKDQEERDALAARGYYEAFQLVKEAVAKILEGAPSKEVVKQYLPQWYQK